MPLEETTKIYNWDNESGSTKDLIYIPRSIREDSSFPLNGKEVEIRINPDKEILEIEDAE